MQEYNSTVTTCTQTASLFHRRFSCMLKICNSVTRTIHEWNWSVESFVGRNIFKGYPAASSRALGRMPPRMCIYVHKFGNWSDSDSQHKIDEPLSRSSVFPHATFWRQRFVFRSLLSYCYYRWWFNAGEYRILWDTTSLMQHQNRTKTTAPHFAAFRQATSNSAQDALYFIVTSAVCWGVEKQR